MKIIAWHGACEVHERFTAEEIQSYRADHPGVKVIAHPECPREVIEVSDFAGSTAAMIDYVRNKKPARVLLVTECSMADNVAAETTGVEFIRPVQFLPAYEAHHAAENSRQPALYARGGARSIRCSRSAHAQACSA